MSQVLNNLYKREREKKRKQNKNATKKKTAFKVN